MAAIFDVNGNYAGDDGMGDVTPVPKPAINPEVARLLARYPAPNFYDRSLVGDMSPRQMVGKAIQKRFEVKDTLMDAGKIGLMVHPATAQYAAAVPMALAQGELALGAAQRYGAEKIYDLMGDKENANRIAQQQSPDFVSLVQKYYKPLMATSPSGKAIQEPALKFLAENLPMVPSGPKGSGFAPTQPSRPLLTPNDARAILGETSRVATQVRDIPTDFANAQSGFRRIDPITNKPTVGTKLQTAADSFAQTMERRKAQGLNPVPGVPDVFQPETQLFAVRPDKSVTIVPKVPPTVSADARVGPFDEQRRAALQMLDALDLGDTQQTTRQYVNRYLAMAPREVKQALKDFNEAELRQMFPNIADIEDAKNAAETLYSDPAAKEQRQRDILNRFAQANPQFKLPTFDEHQQRVNAVQTMIHDEYVPWVSKHAGTPSDPQLLLAQEGKTVMEPEQLLERASDYKPSSVTTRNRVAAGFPAQGTTYHKRLQLQVQLDQAKEAAAASFEIVAAQEAATGPGQQTRVLFPDYKANQLQKEKDEAVVKDLEQKVDNTTLGQAYEDLVDQLVEPHIASAAQAQVMPRMQQFYPKLMKQSADQPVYSVAGGTYDTMALGTKIAEDVMSGKIPLKVVPKLQDFTPLARKYGEEQAQAYVARKEAAKNFVVNANTRLKSIVDQIPQERRFDKLGAIFIDSSMPIEQIDKLASDDTAILDHCIGEAGQVGKKSRDKLTGRQHGWIPMYNVASGKLEPTATRTHTRYGERIANGNYVAATLRDTETGYPITTIGWQALGNGKWATEYLSGFNNREAIKPEYHKSIKDFLNNVAKGNAPLGVSDFKVPNVNDLQNYYSLFDKTDSSSMGFARSELGTAEKEALKANPDILQRLPRFFDKNDFKQAIAAPVPSANAPDNTRALTQAKNVLLAELEALRETGESPAELQVLVDDINHEIADIDARLARVQQQPAPQQATTSITRDDVVRTLIETQLAIDPSSIGLQNLVFSGTVDFDPNNSVQSLRNVREYLTQHVTDAINSNRAPDRTIDALNAVVSNGMIPRLNELIAELSPAQQQAPVPQQAPVAPVPQTRQRAAAIARADNVADLFIEFSDPMLTTPMQFRDLASELLNRGTARSTAQDIAAIGESLGDFVLRASDLNPSNLAEVGRVLNERADLLEQQQFVQQQHRQVPVQGTGLTQQTIDDIQADIVSAFEVDNNPAWRSEVMPIFDEHWDPSNPLTSIENMRTSLEMLMRDVNQTARTYHYISLEDLHEGLGNILTGAREIVAQGNLQNALDTPQSRMAQITREQADTMSIADLAAAVGDPTRYDDIVVRALREIRMNESPASTVVDAIINGGQIGNNDLSALTPVERELIARDVTDAVSALSAARAAPRNTFRQEMVSAYVNALQHPNEAVNNALQNIRNVMDNITIEMQGNGESINVIGNELLHDLGERIRNVEGLIRRGEAITGLTIEGTHRVLRRLMNAHEQITQTFIRNAEQQAAQQRAEPQAELPDIGDFIQTIRRQQGMPVANRVETVVFRIAENISPTANPLGYAQALRAAAHNEESELVEVGLRELADAFEVGYLGATINTMEPDDQHGANQPAPLTDRAMQDIAFELFNDTRRGDNPNAPRNLEDLRTTLQALETAVFDDARFRRYPPAEQEAIQRQVAQHIRSIMNDVGVQLPEIAPTDQQQDAFRDVYSRDTNTMPVIPDELAGHMIDDEMSNIFRTYGQDVGERVGRVIEDRLEHMSFEDDPHGFINSLRRHTARGGSLQDRANVEQGLLDIAQRLEESFTAAFEEREQQRMQSAPVPRDVLNLSDDALAQRLSPADLGEIDASFEAMMADNNGFAADGVPTLPAAAMLTRRFNVYDLNEPAREALARRFEAEERQRQQPPARRGPFQPGGASAVRGVPLGNLNIQPAIRAESLRGPDSQPVRNFLQQVRGLPGVTQEGLATGLMAFENMDPNRRMTKAEFVRELLPSSYDIVDLHGAASANWHDDATERLQDDPTPVFENMGIYDSEVVQDIGDILWNDLPLANASPTTKEWLASQGIKRKKQLDDIWQEAYDSAVEEYEDMSSENNLSGYQYEDVQRLVVDGMGDVYTEFGVTHPDAQGSYHHYDNAPEGMIGHIRGTYNHADPLTLRTATNDSFEAKPGYVIEEIQSDAQKGSQQKAHLHQVHGTLFKAAIQKALEFDADVVYLPTAAVIAAERHRPVKEFAPIYDQAIVKEGLKPLLKIPGVTSKMVNGYHEITFTPKAKEYILNGPGQNVPGYAKGGLVMPVSKYMGNPTLAGLSYKYGGYVH